ncbi:MAG: hypothetical protein AB7S26_22070 [Sandaracinaceae bacterium]
MALPFDIDPFDFGDGATPSHGLMVVPLRLDPAWLARVASATGVNDVERELVRTAVRHRACVVMFRGAREDGTPLREMDPSFGDEELVEAGMVMARALLPLCRHLAAAGVTLFVHCEWPVRECYALREGSVRVLEERSNEKDACAELDAWILQHMMLHVALGHDHVIENLLPLQLSMLDRRVARVAALLERTPREHYE